MSEHVAMGRVCPHCNLSLARYEDPEAVRIIATLERESDALRKELEDANERSRHLQTKEVTINAQRETINALREQLAAAQKELDELKRILADPQAVHLNILRGTIAYDREKALHYAGASDYEELKRDKERLDYLLTPAGNQSIGVAEIKSVKGRATWYFAREYIDAAIAQSKVAS